jgi:hypothetical protein
MGAVGAVLSIIIFMDSRMNKEKRGGFCEGLIFSLSVS